MALLVFTDTTALINLFLVRQLDLLEQIAPGNGRWTQTVRRECLHREKRERENPLSRVQLDGLTEAVDSVLGEPLTPEESEHRAIRDLRRSMASPGDAEDQHLGEAEVITIIRKRFLEALLVTDDAGAAKHAQGNPRCIDTWDILRFALRKGLVSEAQLHQFRSDLRYYGRVPARSFVHDPEEFSRWLHR
ncbi:hypothetical protein [Arthrobacter sp. UM1]|uniref:hypothetical protein n=1 Tax=Arthrobacter sp. UM1 TaxID=2766776 RepID=UPI001CF7111D|nr:hypothetical protein [Arthrobacter sp. UM1]MCB4209018.1 hypothetical protein [Arthrobacter sp. UM1]